MRSILRHLRPNDLIASDHPAASREVYRSLHVGDIDPLTKLVGFPAFERFLSEHLAIHPEPEQSICLAIGDVDGLKRHVEETNESDPSNFGHLAGNRVMAKLGAVARALAAEQLADTRWWCAATFGGDEIILLADVTHERFRCIMLELRHRLVVELPTSVSFAYGRYCHPGPLPAVEAHVHGLRMLSAIDRALFSAKRAARDRGAAPRGELIELTTGS